MPVVIASNTDEDNIPWGIMLMITTAFFFVVLDTIAKHLTGRLPVLEVVWARFLFHFLSMLPFFYKKYLYLLHSKFKWLHLLRSSLLFLTTYLFFNAIQVVNLATASAIMFLTPIIVTALSGFFLNEAPGSRRWLSVIVGMIGALIIIRPYTESMSFSIVLLLIASLSNSFYQILTRKLTKLEGPIFPAFYTAIVGTIITSIMMPFIWVSPQTFDWVALIAIGFVGSIAHLCLIWSLKVSPASAVAPFQYTTLIWATASGYVFFNNLPDSLTCLGAMLIAGSGLYIFQREKKIKANI